MHTRSHEILARDLRERVAALDRRAPRVEREGERAITSDAHRLSVETRCIEADLPARAIPVWPFYGWGERMNGADQIFGPETTYEREGDVGYVTFPCGYTLDADGDGINLYYGAADTSIALARGSITQLLGWLDRHGTGYTPPPPCPCGVASCGWSDNRE